MLKEQTLFGEVDKVQIAIERIRAFEPPDGFILAFSGGKDSQLVYHLAKEAGVKFEAHFHLTTVDPPEVIYFVRDHYPNVIFDRPEITMWDLIVRKKMPPTRRIRYCCEYLKEGFGMGRTVITGVRWEESTRRKKNRSLLELNAYSKERIMLNNDNAEARRMFEVCTLKGKHILNPVIDFTVDEVWEYLNSRGIPHCCLYDECFRRIGCVGCPMSGSKGMRREFERWPKYYDAYLRAFDRMLKARMQAGLKSERWPNAQAVMDWWINGRKAVTEELDDGQYDFLIEDESDQGLQMM